MHFFAHPGHDHSELAAKPADSMTLILIVTAVVVITLLLVVVIIAKKSKTKPTTKAVRRA